ncbi:MAG: tauD [Noviherbaspirillum sp.]|nr:tauD [Noviherbaspirillum sp.]
MESTVQAMPQATLRTRPLSPALGAEILGIDLSQPMDDATFEAICAVWYDNCVICLPGQNLGEMDQVRFGQRFGELAETLHEYESGKGHPALMYVTNERKDGKYVGALPDGEMYFHSDFCYLERPSMATMLYAMVIPSTGGNTLFANMYKAYETLPAATKERIDGLKAVNTYDPGRANYATMRTRIEQASPTARSYAQPMVYTHPVTGRKALYLNRLMTESVVGMPRAESNALLESLFDHQEQPQFIYEHRWTPGDVVIWDNRCTLHARTDFSPDELRKLRRVTVKGDKLA